MQALFIGVPTMASMRYRFGRFELQLDEHRLLLDDQVVEVRPHALQLLAVLVKHGGRLVTKDRLLAQVWGKVVVEENTLQAQVSALRKALGPGAISTVPGQGYRFALDVVELEEPVVATPKHNLPQPLTSFIGREREIASILKWAGQTRLLTLTGAGGCGKTRLALQVATALLDRYPDGVRFVELAPLADPTLVVSAVAKALVIDKQPGKELEETLAESLASRQVLLVLDNAEHLLAACARLADMLLRRCAGLVILVTSRERLGVDGELTFRVPSLSMPERPTAEDVLASEAARLFVDRARLQRLEFEVTAGDAAVLSSICRHLDGIALAIELAAARVRTMSLEELSSRLEHRFAVLTGGSPAAMPRQRTLRSLIDWSHDLLTEAERSVLRRASVFAGGWTLEAAECVCIGAGVERDDVLDLLTSLSDKCLALAETAGDETRFNLLETVRHYALEQLRDSGEEADAKGRHLAHYLDMAVRLGSDGAGTPEQMAGFDRLDRDLNNIITALAWANEADPMSGLSLVGRLLAFWAMRGHFAEGRRWSSTLLMSDACQAPTQERARVLRANGILAKMQGDIVAARQGLEGSLAIGRQMNSPREICLGLLNLGSVVCELEEYERAQELIEEALLMLRQMDNPSWLVLALNTLGVAALESGDVRRAREVFTECVQIQRAGSDGHALALSLGNLGGTLVEEGVDYPAAHALLVEAMDLFLQLRFQLLLVDLISSIATLASKCGEHLLAATLWGHSSRLCKECHYHRGPRASARYERAVAAARTGVADVDAEAFESAWARGHDMPLEDAWKLARLSYPALRSTG